MENSLEEVEGEGRGMLTALLEGNLYETRRDTQDNPFQVYELLREDTL